MVEEKKKPTAATQTSPVRVEAINELGTLSRNRDYRARRVENTMLKEVKGREHWMMHTLLHVYERMETRIAQRIEKSRSDMDNKFYNNSQELVVLKNEISELINLLRTELTETEGRVNTKIGDNLRIIEEKNAESAQIISSDLNAYIKEAMNDLNNDIVEVKREIDLVTKKIDAIEKTAKDMSADFNALEEALRIEIQETAKEINKPLQDAIRDLKNSVTSVSEQIAELSAKKK